jgi:hypothetical protein
MTPKKKKKTRPKAKSAKMAQQRAVTSKTSRKSAKKRPAQKKIVSRATQKKDASRPRGRSGKKKPSVSVEAELKREFQSRNRTAAGIGPRQSADFEGLSRAEEADSESVDELVEEGNVFEAGAVAGVEEADNSDEREVHSHELPEDDVPDEYLDKD